ncbi:hypothetical protein MPLB_1870084 [Mesorhizobium sp. ORS 3324]|nr:hypothetical protein MPLB_1870084 [Mesorhizobium sp. ORS 3324]
MLSGRDGQIKPDLVETGASGRVLLPVPRQLNEESAADGNGRSTHQETWRVGRLQGSNGPGFRAIVDCVLELGSSRG